MNILKQRNPECLNLIIKDCSLFTLYSFIVKINNTQKKINNARKKIITIEF